MLSRWAGLYTKGAAVTHATHCLWIPVLPHQARDAVHPLLRRRHLAAPRLRPGGALDGRRHQHLLGQVATPEDNCCGAWRTAPFCSGVVSKGSYLFIGNFRYSFIHSFIRCVSFRDSFTDWILCYPAGRTKWQRSAGAAPPSGNLLHSMDGRGGSNSRVPRRAHAKRLP